MINGHGDDSYQYAKEIAYNFSSNVYYKGCATDLVAAVKNGITTIENYPSPIANELNIAASNYFGLPSSQFLFGNGATELFYLIAQKYAGKTATIVAPTFSEYQDACTMFKVSLNYVLWQHIEKTKFATDLVFICNPNNPTGKSLSVSFIEQLLITSPNSTFVIDEAYIDFCKKTESCIGLLGEYQNLVVVKSLTKTFAIPGIRLGYLVSSSLFVKELLGYKQPWTVNNFAIAAGLHIFNNYKSLLFLVDEVLDKTEDFVQQINRLKGFKTIPTNTHYFLIELSKGTAKELKEYLVYQHQILVRDATNFNKLEGEFIRVSLQTKEANKALIKALSLWK